MGRGIYTTTPRISPQAEPAGACGEASSRHAPEPRALYPGWYGAEIRIGTIVSPQWMRSTAWSRTTDGK